MANCNGREALRGVEDAVFDLIAEALTPEQWAELLTAPLQHAAAQGNRGLAQKLARAGAGAGSALHEAVLGGHGDIVNDLLENGAPVDSRKTGGKTALHHAAQKGGTSIVELLILNGADKDALDSREWTPLYLATFYGHVAAALALLAGGADPNLRCSAAKSTVLHVAAQKGHVSILRAAIERGADVRAADVYQDTPLHEAGSFDSVGAIDILVEAGANITAPNGSGQTPLHYAAIDVRLEALLRFLSHGANVNTQNDNQETPLYYAACTAGTQGAAKVVDLLLRSGADETIADAEGLKAAEVIGSWVVEEDHLAKDVERVRELLANAPADRRWRRRGYLVLCRARAARLQLGLGQESSSVDDGTGQTASSGAGLERPVVSGDGSKVGVEESAGDEWAGVVRKVLALQEEDVFRIIVGCL